MITMTDPVYFITYLLQVPQSLCITHLGMPNLLFQALYTLLLILQQLVELSFHLKVWSAK
jgi:hypothetical protein